MTEATDAPAGSAEKIAVIKQRIAAKLPMDHPDDNRQKVDQRDDPEPPGVLF